jgi:hypothetical protein
LAESELVDHEKCGPVLRCGFADEHEEERWLCRLTFELRRARRRGAWAAEPMIDKGGSAAQAPRRWASPLERGVRPHSPPRV